MSIILICLHFLPSENGCNKCYHQNIVTTNAIKPEPKLEPEPELEPEPGPEPELEP